MGSNYPIYKSQFNSSGGGAWGDNTKFKNKIGISASLLYGIKRTSISSFQLNLGLGYENRNFYMDESSSGPDYYKSQKGKFNLHLVYLTILPEYYLFKEKKVNLILGLGTRIGLLFGSHKDIIQQSNQTYKGSAKNDFGNLDVGLLAELGIKINLKDNWFLKIPIFLSTSTLYGSNKSSTNTFFNPIIPSISFGFGYVFK